MCNMAAYAGKHRAAPILFKMLQDQEALGGGHYCGIATIFEGKIYQAKICGTTERLAKLTDALELPGTIGIAHSRTPGIDSDAWAQPFLSSDRSVSYCGNGAAGKFPKESNYAALYTRLKAAGADLPSRIDHPVPNYTTLPDGSCVHPSELEANAVDECIKKGFSARKALAQALIDNPAEVATLALSITEPDSVSAVRLNQSLHIGYKEGEYMLATSAIALENQQAEWINLVPRASSLSLYRDHVEIEAIKEFEHSFVPIPYWAQTIRTLDKVLESGGDYDVAELSDQVKTLWPDDKLDESVMITYEYLRENLRTGKVDKKLVSTPGSGAGLTAPHYRFFLKGTSIY